MNLSSRKILILLSLWCWHLEEHIDSLCSLPSQKPSHILGSCQGLLFQGLPCLLRPPSGTPVVFPTLVPPRVLSLFHHLSAGSCWTTHNLSETQVSHLQDMDGQASNRPCLCLFLKPWSEYRTCGGEKAFGERLSGKVHCVWFSVFISKYVKSSQLCLEWAQHSWL